jgi:SAM-dependent methyltransferase
VIPAPLPALHETPELRQAAGETLRPGGLELTRRALAICGLTPGARVLDLGCGLGASAAFLAGQGLAALGLDHSAAKLTEARSLHPGLALVRAEAQDPPLAPVSLDAVFCECVLSLCPRPEAVLAACRRMLRPGGWLVLSDIYLRRPDLAPGPADGPGGGCLAGAKGRGEVLELVAGAGLELALWEDHSHLLNQLAARLVFACGSLAGLWAWLGLGQGCGADPRPAKPGYYLLLARHPEDGHGRA